jgi:uncharacterized protein
VPGPAARSYRGVAGTLLLLHAVLVLLFWLLRRLSPALRLFFSGGTLQTYVISGILMQGLLILLPTVLIIILCRVPTAGLVGGRPRAGSLILGVTIGIPAAVVFQGLNNVLIYALIKNGVRLPEALGSKSPVDSDFLQQPWLLIALVAVVGVIMPGLVEELMFRGVILASLTSAGAVVSALVWQALAFSVFHAEPLFLLPPFLAAFMLAAIRRRSDSLWPAALAHMSLNLSLLAINPLLPRLTSQYLSSTAGESDSLLYASLLAACIAAVALVPLLVLVNHMPVRGGYEATRPDERTSLPEQLAGQTGRQTLRQPGRPPFSRRAAAGSADWKFVLAILVLVVTMILENN